MPSTLFLNLSLLGAFSLSVHALSGLPDKIYGVNIGSWCVVIFSSPPIWIINRNDWGFSLNLGCFLQVRGLAWVLNLGADLSYRMDQHGRTAVQRLLSMYRIWVVSLVFFVWFPYVNCSSVLLLRPTLILLTEYLKGTGNVFVSQLLLFPTLKLHIQGKLV